MPWPPPPPPPPPPSRGGRDSDLDATSGSSRVTSWSPLPPAAPSRRGRDNDLDSTFGSSRVTPWSPLPPPPVAPSRGGRDTDLDETSISLRRLRPYSPGPDRTPAFMPAPQPSIQASISYAGIVRRGLPTPTVSLTNHLEESVSELELELDRASMSDVSVVNHGLSTPTVSLTHLLEESGSNSELELDSPPCLTILKIPEDEPSTPTSPPGGSPSSIDAEHAVCSMFAEEWHSSDAEDDPYFKSLVDNFIIAAKDVCESSEDSIDKKACGRRQTDEFAESALKYYNNDKTNKVKYDLIRATTSCGIFDVERCYGHVNFIAKGNQHDSKEELFFAEIQLDTNVPTCVLSLEGMKTIGGLRESKYDTYHGMGIHIDAQHCYACRSGLKHPGNGALYESGHVAGSGFYHL